MWLTKWYFTTNFFKPRPIIFMVSITWSLRQFYACYIDTREKMDGWKDGRTDGWRLLVIFLCFCGEMPAEMSSQSDGLLCIILYFHQEKQYEEWNGLRSHQDVCEEWMKNWKKRVQERKGSNHKKGQEYERKRLKAVCVSVCMCACLCRKKKMSICLLRQWMFLLGIYHGR